MVSHYFDDFAELDVDWDHMESLPPGLAQQASVQHAVSWIHDFFGAVLDLEKRGPLAPSFVYLGLQCDLEDIVAHSCQI